MALVDDIYYTPYIITFFILLAFFILYGLFFIRKYLNIDKETRFGRNDYLPLISGLIFIFLCVGRIFNGFFDIITEFDPINYTIESRILWKIGTSFQMLAFSLFFIQIEIKVLKGKDKHILLLLFYAFYLVGIITDNTSYIIIGGLTSIIIPLAYLYIFVKSDGIVRKRAFLVFSGFTMFMLSALLMTSVIISAIGIDRVLMHTIINILKIISVNLLFWGFR